MKILKTLSIAILVIFSIAIFAGNVMADEKIKGKVKSIDLKTNTVVITFDDDPDITITVEDDETLNKLKDGRIGVYDEVKVKYVVKDGKNVATYFRKTAGC